tara:strand:- start:3438 stop:3797 length:360 start_codon:yes stop_codon:yes gene_type:complete
VSVNAAPVVCPISFIAVHQCGLSQLVELVLTRRLAPSLARSLSFCSILDLAIDGTNGGLAADGSLVWTHYKGLSNRPAERAFHTAAMHGSSLVIAGGVALGLANNHRTVSDFLFFHENV